MGSVSPSSQALWFLVLYDKESRWKHRVADINESNLQVIARIALDKSGSVCIFVVAERSEIKLEILGLPSGVYSRRQSFSNLLKSLGHRV